MHRTAVYLMAILAGCAFLYMVKLMHDMTGYIGRMSDQVTTMSQDMGLMRTQMESLTAEVAAMRTGVDTMAGVVRSSGEQFERLNPMDMMQRMMVPGQRR